MYESKIKNVLGNWLKSSEKYCLSSWAPLAMNGVQASAIWTQRCCVIATRPFRNKNWSECKRYLGRYYTYGNLWKWTQRCCQIAPGSMQKNLIWMQEIIMERLDWCLLASKNTQILSNCSWTIHTIALFWMQK